jgi:hypothetical protein
VSFSQLAANYPGHDAYPTGYLCLAYVRAEDAQFSSFPNYSHVCIEELSGFTM